MKWQVQSPLTVTWDCVPTISRPFRVAWTLPPKLSEVAPRVQNGALDRVLGVRFRTKQPKGEPVCHRKQGLEQEQEFLLIIGADVADHNRREAHSTVLSTSPAKSLAKSPPLGGLDASRCRFIIGRALRIGAGTAN